jgi:hypothetical protein
LGYSIVSKHRYKAPYLQTHVISKLGHVSEHVATGFGLVDAKLSFQGAHPGHSIIAQLRPVFIHGLPGWDIFPSVPIWSGNRTCISKQTFKVSFLSFKWKSICFYMIFKKLFSLFCCFINRWPAIIREKPNSYIEQKSQRYSLD